MYDLQDSAQGSADLLAEAFCPLCEAELKGDLSVSGIEARCPNCHGSLWCQRRTPGSVVVLDMMPRQTFVCEFSRLLRGSCLPFSGCSPVVVNLSNVELADSTFLAGLVLLKKRIDDAGGRLILYGLRSLVREMFAFTRLAEFFVIVATEADALRMLKRGDAGRRELDAPPDAEDPDVAHWRSEMDATEAEPSNSLARPHAKCTNSVKRRRLGAQTANEGEVR